MIMFLVAALHMGAGDGGAGAPAPTPQLPTLGAGG